jgi:peptidoglycan hydrolase-like protein with peptidoglycan-binding domain
MIYYHFEIKNKDIRKNNFIPGGPPTYFVTIPEYITVHLGNPDDEAENVTIPYIDYIKNVASSELYPTWPENALRANIYAIQSFTLNRVVLEWYRSRGYNFDITNSTLYDHAYVQNRGIYDNIATITDEIFNQYIVKDDQVIPLSAKYCDGRVSKCDGLYQWGTVDLANNGYTPMDILKYYYGDNISVTEAPVGGIGLTYPGEPLKLGDSSLVVLRDQLALNRISDNFPAIPKIPSVSGYFDESTESAVKAFQKVFELPVTGIIDMPTFYKIRQIYVAVTKLSELSTSGSIFEEIYGITLGTLLKGDIRPRATYLQYILNVLSLYYNNIQPISITGIFDEQTRMGLIEFQKIMGLPATGILDSETWNMLYESIRGIFNTLPPQEIYLPLFRYPSIEFKKGMGLERPGVSFIQQMLSYISLTIPEIPLVPENGLFDEETEKAVIAFQTKFGLEPTGTVNEETWNELARIYREQRYGNLITP